MNGTRPQTQRAKMELSRRVVCLLSCLPVWMCCTARADSVTFSGTTIPLRDCKIEAIQGGQVTFLDSGKQRQRRPLETIAALGFDGLPRLDQAEHAVSHNDLNTGLTDLLNVFVSADADVKRLWIESRLARVHDLRQEYVQAAGHAAGVMALSDDPYWIAIEPTCKINEPDYAAAKEAIESLQNASRKIKSMQLKASIERMIRQVQPLHERLAKSYRGAAIAPGSTVSGISKQDIVNGKLDIKPPTATRTAEPPRDTAPVKPEINGPPKAQAADGPSSSGGDSQAAIDSLLTQSKWAEALAICERVESNPGERDLAHFLFQYGTALAQQRRNDDSAMMFARCAVLFSDSPDGSQSLIQLAVLYRDHYHDIATARRLLQRAVDEGGARGHDSAVLLARELLGSL